MGCDLIILGFILNLIDLPKEARRSPLWVRPEAITHIMLILSSGTTFSPQIDLLIVNCLDLNALEWELPSRRETL